MILYFQLLVVFAVLAVASAQVLTSGYGLGGYYGGVAATPYAYSGLGVHNAYQTVGLAGAYQPLGYSGAYLG